MKDFQVEIDWYFKRRRLLKAASPAVQAPSSKAGVAPPEPINPKHKATAAAPWVCPIRRAIAMTALAPALRFAGALDMIARRLGDWNSPNPSPHQAMRKTMDSVVALASQRNKLTMPVLNRHKPIPPSSAGATRSDKRPANGARRATTAGQAVMRKPVWMGSRFSTCSK